MYCLALSKSFSLTQIWPSFRSVLACRGLSEIDDCSSVSKSLRASASGLAPLRRQDLRDQGPIAFGALAIVEGFRLGATPEHTVHCLHKSPSQISCLSDNYDPPIRNTNQIQKLLIKKYQSLYLIVYQSIPIHSWSASVLFCKPSADGMILSRHRF